MDVLFAVTWACLWIGIVIWATVWIIKRGIK